MSILATNPQSLLDKLQIAATEAGSRFREAPSRETMESFSESLEKITEVVSKGLSDLQDSMENMKTRSTARDKELLSKIKDAGKNYLSIIEVFQTFLGNIDWSKRPSPRVLIKDYNLLYDNFIRKPQCDEYLKMKLNAAIFIEDHSDPAPVRVNHKRKAENSEAEDKAAPAKKAAKPAPEFVQQLYDSRIIFVRI